MKNKIHIVRDYRGAFNSKVSNAHLICSLDIELLQNEFSKLGWQSDVLDFGSIAGSVLDGPILLTSSEDNGGLYKGYIESIALGLKLSGNYIIPDFDLLKAHHNKVMVEVLRGIYFPDQAELLNTQFFGCYEDLVANVEIDDGKWPKVFKKSSGAGSEGVYKATSYKSLLTIARKNSRSSSIREVLQEAASRFRKGRLGYVNRSLNRNSFIVQNFISNMDGDYKVLVYGHRYFVMKRSFRKGDFRASGSGIRNFTLSESNELMAVLDFAKKCFDCLGNPMISLDIGVAGEKPILIEFQAVSFGPVAAEQSTEHFVKENGIWKKIKTTVVLESIFAEAVVACLTKSKK